MFSSYPTFQETSNIPHDQTINANFTPLNSQMNQDYGHKYQDFDPSFLDQMIDGGDHNSNYSNINSFNYSQNPSFMQEISTSNTYSGSSSASSFDATPTNICMNENSNMGIEKEKKVERHAIAFRTKTELEILDDGYKWRKYGKKKVKSNTNPRNYYKCSSGGCKVKKKVERDGNDCSYLITTYEGTHNHESPFVIYCHELPAAASFLNE